MNRSIKVGAFVLAAFLLTSLTIFVIGDNRRVWDPKITYRASFSDVAGLKAGSPVRMGGYDIGTVSSVGHGRDAKDMRVYVTISVAKSEAVRIRTTAIAHVANKGLLGDKMIDITVSDPNAAELDPKDPLPSEEPLDLNKYITRFDDISLKAQGLITNLEAATQPLKDPKFADDLKGTVGSLRVILDGVAHNQEGAAYKLVFDPNTGRSVERTLAEVAGAAGEVRGLAADVHATTARMRTGPGLLHTLLYDPDTAKNANDALSEVSGALRAVRERNGLAHVVVYGDDNTQRLMGNIAAMSDDARAVMANVRAGKGTIGALLVDPSLYDDLKSMLGNLERNQVLRALVRYSIKNDEERTPATGIRVQGPPASTSPPASPPVTTSPAIVPSVPPTATSTPAAPAP